MSRQRPFIGMFMNLCEDDREISGRREAFLQGVGSIPGLTIATCFGAGDYDNYGQKAQDLRNLRVDGAGPDLFFATCWPSLRAVRGVAGDTPIVFAGNCDLRANPSTNTDYADNVFGFISYGKNLVGEWVRLLRAVKPDVARAAVLYDMDGARPNGPRERAKLVFDEIAAQGRQLSPVLDATTQINCASARLRDELEAFAKAAPTPGGVVIAVSVLAARNRQTIIDAANEFRLPVVYPNRLYTFQGGLVSKGTYIQGLYRSAGAYARRLLNQERPSPKIDLTQTGLDPDPKKVAVFETIINAKAAAAIGLTVDSNMLTRVRPDLVID
jgi:ABC-type uncharacterized transport system substrate-binding protein